ncbi:hypothetical protein PRIPAC_96288, partial [Pristionchus pacificus]
GFMNSTDVILIADHGHHEITNLDSVLCIDQEINGVAGIVYNVSDTSIFAQSDAHAEEIYTNLTNNIMKRKLEIKIYRKSVDFSLTLIISSL